MTQQVRRFLQNYTFPGRSYSLAADLVRIAAIAGVVGIHILNPVYARPDFFGGTVWWLALILDSLFRTSVPLFIMLSGALLLSKQTTLSTTLDRIQKRLLIPLVFFYAVQQVLSWWSSTSQEVPFNPWNILGTLAIATGSPLYFLVGLALLYLCIPVLQPFLQQATRKEIRFYTTFFLLNGALATLSTYLVFHSTAAFGSFTLGFMWLGYFLAGYYIKQYYTQLSRQSLIIISAVFASSLAATVLSSYLQWQQHHLGTDRWFMGYLVYSQEFLSVTVIPLALTAAVLLFNISNKQLTTPVLRKFISFLASVSFGVYLLHTLVLQFLQTELRIIIDNPTVGLYGYLLQTSVYTVSASIVLTMCIQRIPVLKKILGE